MAIFRTKNYVPEVYVSESRDFQLFLKVLDFVQNSIKYDIDTMVCSLSTEDIPSQYLERLKSKLGFYVDHHYDERSLRLALIVFPFIMRYKGSKKGITMCVTAYLKYLGIREPSRIDIYNEHSDYPYTVRIGVPTTVKNTRLLTDLLAYILPPGYFVEIYFYKSADIGTEAMEFATDFKWLTPTELENTTIRKYMSRKYWSSDEFAPEYEDADENRTYSTTQLGMVYNPNNKKED